MRIDRFTERQKTASLKDKRLNTIGRIIFVFCLLSIVQCPLFAQSNLTYELKVGTTGENTLLAEFPESYAGEKVNISIQYSAFRSAGFRLRGQAAVVGGEV